MSVVEIVRPWWSKDDDDYVDAVVIAVASVNKNADQHITHRSLSSQNEMWWAD